jgi:hypothetical protein
MSKCGIVCLCSTIDCFNSYKLKCETCERGSSKQRQLVNFAVNYLLVPVLLLELHTRLLTGNRTDIDMAHSSYSLTI